MTREKFSIIQMEFLMVWEVICSIDLLQLNYKVDVENYVLYVEMAGDIQHQFLIHKSNRLGAKYY